MNTLSSPNFACRYCQHYAPEGRRGGHCQQLGAPVRGEWKACSLMIPSFSPTLEAFSMNQQSPTRSYNLESTSTNRVLATSL